MQQFKGLLGGGLSKKGRGMFHGGLHKRSIYHSIKLMLDTKPIRQVFQELLENLSSFFKST